MICCNRDVSQLIKMKLNDSKVRVFVLFCCLYFIEQDAGFLLPTFLSKGIVKSTSPLPQLRDLSGSKNRAVDHLLFFSSHHLIPLSPFPVF